ncbi:TolC family protein [Clostridium neonatale]|uniref:TolC family protein n=1 Tax=Clostridium neonatale TaxID=137838 RepID=UPI003D3360A6
MKKNINKLIAIGIGLSVIVGNVSPVLASDVIKDSKVNTISGASENNSKTLTLDKAVEAAVEKDEDIKKYTVEMNYYKNYEDYLDEKNDDSDYKEDSNDVSYNTAKQNREFQKDKVEYNVSTLFNSIISGQEEIDVLEEQINVQSRKLEETKLKHQKGLITSVDLTDAENKLNSNKADLVNKKNVVADNKEKLTLLTGINIADYVLDNTLQYNVYRIDGDIDNYIDEKIDTYLKWSEENVDLMKDQVDHLKDDGYDDIPSKPDKPDKKDFTEEEEYNSKLAEYNSELAEYNSKLEIHLSYLDLKKASDTQDLSVQQKRKDLKYKIRSTYTDLNKLEDQISNAKDDVELENKKLANAKLQYQLGLISTSDYNENVANAKSADVKLRRLVDDYNNTVISIEKPWAKY